MTSSKPEERSSSASARRDTEAFLKTMRGRFRLAQEALTDIHKEAKKDWEFRLGQQWEQKIEAERTRDGRPCYTINRIPQFLRQVTGEQKKQRPAIQVSPIGDGADVETAEIIQGVARHIERTSNAEEAYDTAFEAMATGGFGFLRIVTDYVDGDSFDQEIKIVRDPNPFAHYPDPRCKELDYSDAKFWFVEDWLSREDFQDEYPESALQGLGDFQGIAAAAPEWIERDAIRVAEYFWVEEKKVAVKKGKASRTKTVRTVHWCKTNGLEILEEADVPGEYIPIVPCLGEEVRLDGKRHLIGLVRYARSPQQLYNIWQSAMAETIALAPKAPFQATPTQIEGFEDLYEQANTSNLPYLPYNPDPKADGKPSRNFGEPPIQAITQAIAHADNDLKTTTGLYDASLGAPGPEQSGKAILLRQQQGSAATFGFVDSMKRTIKHAGRIVLGWIPVYYDAPRVVRIVNPDGSSDTVKINQPFTDDAGLKKVFDLTVGRYDVSISTGPSFDAAREEAASSMLQLVQAQPALMQVIGDLLVKNFDWPMAEEISERLKKLLPPQLQDQDANALPQAQAKLAQAQQMIQQLSQTVHKLVDQKQAKLPELASRERIALIQAKAGIIEAALKAQSQEAIVAFQADLEQIDRQLALLPDPGMETQNGDGAGAPQPATPQVQPQQPLAA
ncbi:MAG TPA: portal protein [Bryobacteraceae bacterium]|nr:portal protein [Bryobacteraceae bacterium]